MLRRLVRLGTDRVRGMPRVVRRGCLCKELAGAGPNDVKNEEKREEVRERREKEEEKR